jgi:hypothetical protein
MAAHQHFGVARRIVLILAHGLAEHATLGNQSHLSVWVLYQDAVGDALFEGAIRTVRVM